MQFKEIDDDLVIGKTIGQLLEIMSWKKIDDFHQILIRMPGKPDILIYDESCVMSSFDPKLEKIGRSKYSDDQRDEKMDFDLDEFGYYFQNLKNKVIRKYQKGKHRAPYFWNIPQPTIAIDLD